MSALRRGADNATLQQGGALEVWSLLACPQLLRLPATSELIKGQADSAFLSLAKLLAPL